MSAATLREAAAKIREVVAKAAAQSNIDTRAEGVWLNSRFYMTCDPAFAGSVARWLEVTADAWDEFEGKSTGWRARLDHEALAVARAYLGEPE